ncbi:MAG: radical SAM family heme chaperone HemW [Phycisphaerae bacterium]
MPCKKNRPELSPAPPARSVYVHVPLCRRKCRYCDFYSLASPPQAARAWLKAVQTELAMRRGQIAPTAETVFVGGGTPTALEPPVLGELLETLGQLLGRDTEFSVEANPSSVDAATAKMLAGAGVNRVSLGAQSLDPKELATLGRLHGPAEVPRAVGLLREAGIANINLDAMYGLPGQTLRSWTHTLEGLVELEPAHLSAYALSFEEGTPLWRDLAEGKVEEMPEHVQERCYRVAIDILEAAGLEHYELSNFARRGRQCLHNLTYWHNRSYVGLGPAGASYLGGVRSTNCCDMEAYASALSEGRLPETSSEQLTGPMKAAEALMLGLRLIEGVERDNFAARYGADLAVLFPQTVEKHVGLGTLAMSENRLQLTPKSWFVSNSVLVDFLDEADRWR